MEFYAQIFAPILPHLKEFAVLYILGIPLLIGLIVVTHRYSVPAIVFGLEIVVGAFLLHCMVHVSTQVFAWFKNNSAMRMVRDPELDVHWTTPLLRFWELEKYDPRWIIWVEVGLVLLLLLAIYHFRPLKPQYKHKSRYNNSPPARKTNGNGDVDGWGEPKDYSTRSVSVLSSRKKS